MSEPADEEVLVPEQQEQQPSTEEVVQKEEPKQENEEEKVVDDKATEESQPAKEEEDQKKEEEVEIQQEKEEKDEPAEPSPEDRNEGLPNLEAEDSQSQEEQQQQSQDDEEGEPEKTMDDSLDTVQMPITDTPERALEDEEMPSMVTISSTSRIDDSEFYKQDETESYNKQDESESDKKQDESESYDKEDEESKSNEVEKYSPQPVVAPQKNDSDSDSVVMIDDDDDDEEEANRGYESREYDRSDSRRPRHDDDEEEDEGESSYDDEYDGSSSFESEDEDQYNDKYDRRYKRNERRDVDEDVEDDDEEDEDGDNEDEYMDDQDCGDGGSDDAVLRHSSNGLSKHQKERSSSLQDLSLMQGSSPKNRHNVNPFSQKAIFERTQGKAKPYAHVPSKVKQYIDNGAEQRRISSEKRKRSIDEARQKNDEPSDIQIQRSQEVVMACQTMKNYAEKTLKEVAESEENEKMVFLQQGVENGELSLIPRQMMPSQNVEIMNKANEMEIDLVDEDDEKRPTYNGTMPKEHQNNYVTERKGILRRQDGPPKSSIFNGEEDPLSFQQPLDNLRTLSYDEYMRGPVSEVNEVVVNRIEMNEVQSLSVQNAEIEDDSGLRIESVVSNFSEEKIVEDFQNQKTPPPIMNNQEAFYREDPEVEDLRAQLNTRNQQFESLSQAYQKTMSESMAMRMELENLRKAVAYYQEQMKSPRPETRVSGVQTEIQAKTRDMPLIDLEGIDPKLGVSAVSTQWSDTTGSAATISMDPPNVTTALNSDDSGQQPKTPLPKRNALSRAFMTSTKILQTLSSIAHGKTRVDKFAKSTKISEAEKSAKLAAPNSKKRKASDALDESTQPTKIPKSSDQEGITPESPFVNPNAMEQDSAGASSAEKKAEDLSDDDVKVYVYPEDEDGREQSFLIQAKEVSDNPKPGVRECGPYLLGNVEVYMTEVNGTINIWGKELSQTSQTSQTSQMTEDPDASVRSKDLRQNLKWQSTPRIFNKNEAAATTSKKSRMVPKYMQQSQHEHPCEHNHRLSMPSCHDHHQQHHHSCCSSHVVEPSCGCVHEQQKRSPIGCCKAKSMPNVNQNCCCSGHKPLARRHSFNPTDEEDSDDSDDVNRTLQAENFSPHSFSKSKTMHQRSTDPRRSTGVSSNDPSSMCENENDPLITAKHLMEGLEGPEKKRKRKVRGILMDLLRKGCVTDCRVPLDKSSLHHTTSIYEPSTSAQHKASCLPSQPSHTHRPNERCSSCSKPDKTHQLESQMERFREEMDKLRSQSDTLAGMIQALKNADVIN